MVTFSEYRIPKIPTISDGKSHISFVDLFTSQLNFVCFFQSIGIGCCRRYKGMLKIVYLLTVWNPIRRVNLNARKLSNFTRLEYKNLSSLRKENSMMGFKHIGKMGQLLACAEFWVLCALNSGVKLAWELITDICPLLLTLQAQIARQKTDHIITQL